MGGLRALCCGKGDRRDIDNTPPSRPVQKPLEKTTQPLAGNVHTETVPVKEANKETVPRDLWKEAYESLDPDRKKYLSVEKISATEAINGVIADTTAKYEEWTKGGLKIQLKDGSDFNVRDSAEKIISAAMNVSDVITKFVSFDPTGHGAC